MSDTTKLTKLGSNSTKYTFDHPDKSTLETFEYVSKTSQAIGFDTDEFTSLCPMTSQPDFATIKIVYIPRKLGVESKSLKLYLFSFRNHGSFHEDCISQITNDIFDKIDPYFIRVVGDFTPRGGIAIKPVSIKYSDDADRTMISELLLQYDRVSTLFKR